MTSTSSDKISVEDNGGGSVATKGYDDDTAVAERSTTTATDGNDDDASLPKGGKTLTTIDAHTGNGTGRKKQKQNMQCIQRVKFNATQLMLFCMEDTELAKIMSLDVNSNTINSDIAAKIQNTFAGNPLKLASTEANTVASSMVSVIVTCKPTSVVKCDNIDKVSDMNKFASSEQIFKIVVFMTFVLF